jgi:hypothetical protein
MNQTVIRLSLSGSQETPNLLLRKNEYHKVRKYCLISWLCGVASVFIEMTNLINIYFYYHLTTILCIIIVYYCYCIIKERRIAIETGVIECDIVHIKSFLPFLFLLPGIFLTFIVLRRMIFGMIDLFIV